MVSAEMINTETRNVPVIFLVPHFHIRNVLRSDSIITFRALMLAAGTSLLYLVEAEQTQCLLLILFFGYLLCFVQLGLCMVLLIRCCTTELCLSPILFIF